jgi:fructokinase
VIAVIGEALVDLVAGGDGRVDARLGGGPYNAARTLARLGRPAVFLGRLSADGFGRQLGEGLAAEGVALGLPEPSPWPTTLSVATLDATGAAGYGFYLDRTAAADVTYEALRRALPRDPLAVHLGTLGLVMEPAATAAARLVRDDVPADALVLLDPNCRPGAVTDEAAYRGRLGAIARRADIVKASTEDLAYLYPGLTQHEAADALLAAGVALVLVTDGPRAALAILSGTVLSYTPPAVQVADTIGAGDAFGGGFLAWWMAHGLGRDELRRPGPGQAGLVGAALRAAAATAALTCTRPGADPPTLADLTARGWWPAAGA